jgi:isocitrate/isopropylmalate dehydrogenase
VREGTAPDIAARHLILPAATPRCAAMMREHPGSPDEALRLRGAVEAVARGL